MSERMEWRDLSLLVAFAAIAAAAVSGVSVGVLRAMAAV